MIFPNRACQPWDSDPNRARKPHKDKTDPLAIFLNGACLRHYYNTLRKTLRITDPIQLGRLRRHDLLLLGMTDVEMNRLASRMLDCGIPIGELLNSDDIPDDDQSCHRRLDYSSHNVDDTAIGQLSDVDAVLQSSGDGRRKRISVFRKFFLKKSIPYYSAPVSPTHNPSRLPSLDHPRRAHQLSPQHLDYSAEHHFGSNSAAGPSRYDANHGTMASSTVDSKRPFITCLISEKDIKLHSRIGLGSFGVVRRADWKTPSGETIPVAVKLLRPEAISDNCFISFLEELRTMQCLSHPNLIRLYGVVLSNPIMMVTELAPLRSVLLHLRAHSICVGSLTNPTDSPAPSVPRALQVDSLWDMGVQIAQGMAYLSSRGLVHRDLAARNILLVSANSDAFPHVKIGDFGLVRSITYQQPDEKESISSTGAGKTSVDDERLGNVDAVYTGRMEQRIPFAWCAPESLRSRVFSQASDVWSWAVTCWEIWTFGAAPWPGLNAQRLLYVLDTDRRLTWPRLTCPRRLYQIWLACWRRDAQKRPSFSYLASRLDKIRPVTVTAQQSFDEADRLGLDVNDQVIVIDARPQNFWWRGQNRRTGEIGSFPRGVVKSAVDWTTGCITDQQQLQQPHWTDVENVGTGETLNEPDNLNSHYADLLSLTYDTPPSIAPAYADVSANDNHSGSCNSSSTWFPLKPKSSSMFFDSNNTRMHLTTDESASRPEQRPNEFCDAYAPQSVLGTNFIDCYDDDNDERYIIDRTPHSKIGEITLLPHNINFDASVPSDDVACPVLDPISVSGSDYLTTVYLPPPPGPEETASHFPTNLVSTTSDRLKSLHMCAGADDSAIAKHAPSVGVPSTQAKNSTKVNNVMPPASKSATDDGDTCFGLSRRLSFNSLIADTTAAPERDADPSLIDMYTYIPDPAFTIPFLQRTSGPSAPVYEPSHMCFQPGLSMPYCFPYTRPYSTVGSLNPSACFQDSMSFSVPPANWSASSSQTRHQSSSVNANSSTSHRNPFGVDVVSAASDESPEQITSRLPTPPQDDPFDWDCLARRRHSSSNSAPMCSEAAKTVTEKLPPPVSRSRILKQSLVGSAAPFSSVSSSSSTNPFCSDLLCDLSYSTFSCPFPQAGSRDSEQWNSNYPGHHSMPSACNAKTSFHDAKDTFRTVNANSERTNPFINQYEYPTPINSPSTERRHQPSDLSPEVNFICTNVPGIRPLEAQRALAHVLNPFSPDLYLLSSPVIPSAPEYDFAPGNTTASVTNMWKAELAVRHLRATRLQQLGLLNFESCCRVLSGFHWNLADAANWVVDNHHHHNGRRVL